jgi:hypothetical protein
MMQTFKMKRGGLLILAGTSLLFAAPQPGRATVLDFDSGVENNAVGVLGIASFSNAIYASPGNPVAAFNRNSGPADTIATGVPSTFITDSSVPIAAPNPLGISISFSTPVNGLQLELLDLDWTPSVVDEKYLITLVDASNTTFTFQGQASSIFPTGAFGDGSVLPLTFAQTNIVSVNILSTVVATGNRAGLGVDNIAFTPTPEPSTALLLVGSLCVTALHRRRKQPAPQMPAAR